MKRARSRNTTLVICSTLIGVLVVEVFLRVMGISFPEFGGPNRDLGWAPIAETSGTYAADENVVITINREGFRDVEHPILKPDHTFRIAVLGDSFTEAREVPLKDTYWKLLEGHLGKCMSGNSQNVEMINFGVSGYGTAQQLLLLDKHVLKYDPDIILLAIFTGNDIWNNSLELDGHERRPYFKLDNGRLVLQKLTRTPWDHNFGFLWADVRRWVFNRVRIAQAIYQARRHLRFQSKYAKLNVYQQLNYSLDKAIYVAPRDVHWQEAWQVTEGLIAAINEKGRANGSTLWIATLTNPIQVYPDAAIRSRLTAELGVADLKYPDRRIARFANVNKIPHVTLLDSLRKYSEEHKINLHGGKSFSGGHWNKFGHQIAAKGLSTPICEAYGSPET